MKMKRVMALMLCGVLALSACSSSDTTEEAEDTTVEETTAEETEPEEAGIYTPGTYTGEGRGFEGTVTVTITTDENSILDVTVEGPEETPTIGGAALDRLAEQIMEAQSAEIDGVTGASSTSNGARTAAAEAISKAMGTESDSGEKAEVADGTYTAKAPSFGIIGEMELEVTFEGNEIKSIDTVNAGSATQADEDEYSPIYATVEENLYPRIIEAQSLAVDNISGATVSSNAAKTIIAEIIDENGGNSSEWYTEVEKSDEVVVLEDYDVVIVGLGASGMASYLSAAENGATVFGIETAAKIGGNGTNTAGPLGVNPEKAVEANGGELFVDPDELFDAWMEYTDNDAKEDLVRLFIEESGETFGWLEDNYDFYFLDAMFSFYDSHMWPLWTMYYDSTMTSKDLAYVNSMEQAKGFNEKNDYMTELTATSLIVDDEGTVIGVEAEYYDGTTYQIYGDSVILAAGGYIGNAEMCEEYTGYTWHTKGMTQCDGFSITEALKLGGALYNEDVAVEDHIAQVDTIIRSDEYSNDDKAILTSLVLDLNYQIIDSNGNDFDANYNGLGISFNAWEAGSNYYVLINEEEYEAIKTDGLIEFNEPMFFFQGGTYEMGTPVENLDDIIAMGQEYNDVIIADSMEDLEAQLGFTVNLDDVHGQTEGKIYCIIGAAYVYSTCGGLDVDTNMNLLKEDGTPIENVYVVGNDSLGVLNESNKAYVTYGGCAQGWALTSGRLAGANAAAKYAG